MKKIGLVPLCFAFIAAVILLLTCLKSSFSSGFLLRVGIVGVGDFAGGATLSIICMAIVAILAGLIGWLFAHLLKKYRVGRQSKEHS